MLITLLLCAVIFAPFLKIRASIASPPRVIEPPANSEIDNGHSSEDRPMSAQWNPFSLFRRSIGVPKVSNSVRAPFFHTSSSQDKVLSYAGTVMDNVLSMHLLEYALVHLNAQPIPDSKVNQLFEYMRDRRYFPNKTAQIENVDSGNKYIVSRKRRSSAAEPEFLRRLTWLYPDDGCWHRAEMAALWAQDIMPITPKAIHKIYLFGSPLNVSTPYSRNKWVSWEFHSAPIMRSNLRYYVVLDPSLDHNRPLTYREWIMRQIGERTTIDAAVASGQLTGFAITNRFVFNPTFGNQCNATRSMLDQQNLFLDPYVTLMLKNELDRLLSYEWRRVTNLGRNPVRELGDFPPWKQ